MVSLYHTGTEYVANEITLHRGDVAAINAVGVYHTLDPEEIPATTDFVTVTLVDGTSPGDPLAEDGKIDVLSLIGPKIAADVNLSTPGDYQRWVLVQTDDEDIIRRPDVLEIL